MKNAAPPAMEHEHSHAMPCHDGDMQTASKQDDTVKMQGCECICTLQTVTFPVPELLERIARTTTFVAIVPLPPLEFHPPIDAPPKSFS